MKVGELSGYLKQRWPAIREQLLSGTYEPQAVSTLEMGSMQLYAHQLRHHGPLFPGVAPD